MRRWITDGDWTPRLLLLAALAVGFLVRWPGLATDSLWLDELVSGWIVSADTWADLVGRRALAYSATPPLYFLVARFSVLTLGKSELALRLPSLVAGLVLLWSLYHVGSRLFSARVGSLAALLGALSSHQVFYSQDARPYALAVLAGLWCVYSLLGYTASARRRYLVGHLVAALAALYTHYVCLVLVAFTALYFVGWWLNAPRTTRPAFGPWLLVQAVMIAAYAPGLAALGRLWTNRDLLAYMAKAPAPSDLLVFLHLTPLALSLGMLVVAAAPLAGWVGWRIAWEPIRYRGAALVSVALWFAVPAGLLWGVAAGASPSMIHVRYLLLLSVPCLLLVAVLFDAVRPAGLRYAWLAGYVILALVMSPGAALEQGRLSDHGQYEDWRWAAAVVKSEGRPGDLVILRSGLVEAEFLLRNPDDPLQAALVCSPLGDFYLDEPRVLVGLPRDLVSTDLHERYFAQRVLPAVRRVERFLLVVRIDDVGEFSNTYYRRRFEDWLRRLGGPEVVPVSSLQKGTILIVSYRVGARPALQPIP